MYTIKTFPLWGLLAVSGHHFTWLIGWAVLAVAAYEIGEYSWLAIPWLPISLIGTAVAFYIGFKNNSSYDRMWEARKVWGAIVNSSRSWGTMVKHFSSNQFREEPYPAGNLYEIQRRIIFRHIAWLFTLRQQLLKPVSWEHSEGKMTRHLNRKRIRRLNEMMGFPDTPNVVKEFLSHDDLHNLAEHSNQATQLIDMQSAELAKLRELELIDDFRHMEMQKVLSEFYVHQGKCERIKNFPFPRQYGSISYYFVAIFILLMPFGMLSEFDKLGEGLVWMTVPFATIVGWVFLMMELVGDYSENPFERLAGDIPMYNLCRTIEIDLKEMLGDNNIPAKNVAINGVLL